MPNTGAFHLHEVSGPTSGSPGQFTSISMVRATCTKYSHTFHATAPPELVAIAGGTILCCSACGTRQAISNARFDLFSIRLTAESKPRPE
ncbi:hypothetical protein D9M71_601240 [compost metagenome]